MYRESLSLSLFSLCPHDTAINMLSNDCISCSLDHRRAEDPGSQLDAHSERRSNHEPSRIRRCNRLAIIRSPNLIMVSRWTSTRQHWSIWNPALVTHIRFQSEWTSFQLHRTDFSLPDGLADKTAASEPFGRAKIIQSPFRSDCWMSSTTNS